MRLQALSSTLPWASAHESQDLALELLDLALSQPKARGEAFATLVRAWTGLSEDARSTSLAAMAGRWDEVGDALDRGGIEREGGAVALFCRHAGRSELATIVVRLVRASDEDVAQAGERALLAMVDASLATSTAEDASQASVPRSVWIDHRDRIERSIVDLLGDFPTHRRRGVALAAAAMLDHWALANSSRAGRRALASAMETLAPETASALRLVVRTGREPQTRERAWLWLGFFGLEDPMGLAASDRVGVAHSIEDHDALLRNWHWVHQPRRAARWRALASGAITNAPPGSARADASRGVPWPSPKQFSSLSAPARRGVVRLSAPIDRSHALASMLESAALTDPDEAFRLSCAASLEPERLRDLTLDSSSAVARPALTRWLTGSGARGGTDGVAHGKSASEAAHAERVRVLSALLRSEDPWIRLVAESELLAGQAWSAATPASRRAAAAALRRDHAGFLDSLRLRMRHAQTPERTRALALVRALGLADEMLPELLELAGSSEPDDGPVVPTAISTLRASRHPDAMAAVRHAMAHSRSRACSNAIEAAIVQDAPRTPCRDLMMRDAELYERLIELKSDPRHRVRATAIRELLRAAAARSQARPTNASAPATRGGAPRANEPAATNELRIMLGDDRPMHRVAALWAVERVALGPGLASLAPDWNAIASKVAMISREDEEPSVRFRAARVARRILACSGASEPSTTGAPA